MYHFEFTPYAANLFHTLPKDVQKRIKKKLLFWQTVSDPLAFAKSLHNFEPATHRFRIGDYRIIIRCEKKSSILLVLKVGHRKNIYRVSLR